MFEPELKPRPKSEEKIDILLVDDRPENLLTLETVLISPSLNLIKASSGDEALRYLLDHEPAVILMDVQMPDLDGFETASIIKRSERTRDIPIIFVTALNKDERYVHKGYLHGAIDYIYKPYDVHILKSKVAVFADLARKTKRLIHAERELLKTERQEREREVTQLELKSLKREQSEQKKYLDLVDGISHGIVWSAESQRFAMSFVSPSAEQLLGYKMERWLSEPDFLMNHIYPDDRNAVLDAVEKAKTDSAGAKVEHRLVSDLGKTIWFHTQIRAVRAHDGSTYELRGLSVDITPMKEAEELLRQNKARSDFLAASSFLLGQSLNYEDTLKQVGDLTVPKFANWFAVHLSSVPGEVSLAALCSNHTASESISAEVLESLGISKVFESGTGKFIPEVSLSDCVECPLQLKSSIMVPLASRGKTVGVMTWLNTKNHFSNDDLKMAEDLAKRASVAIENAIFHQVAQAAIRVRDEFLSVASHELKTPLTPLKLQTQMLGRMLRAPGSADLKNDKVEKILKTFDRQLDRLSLLVEELLDISKMSNGQLSLSLEEFDLIELMRDILNRFSEQLDSVQCEVTFNAPMTGPLMVCWDRFRIEQVIVNLITNAAKYGHGKPIHITLSHQEKVIELSVRDHGIGIAPNDLDRIFNRFERAVSGQHFSGLGLGLYIVTQLLDAHGGKIRVSSEVGQGSTFTITVPEKAERIESKEPTVSEKLDFAVQYAKSAAVEIRS